MTHNQLLALTGDQIKYFDFSLKWPDLLTQNIPFGFPLFLHLIPIQALPYVTLALWVSALIFLEWCLARSGFRLELILGIVAPLALSMLMRPWAWHGNPYFYANTERLTAILSTVIFGLVVLAIKERKWYWTVAILVFVVCVVRSAMLFLPLVVCLTIGRKRMLLAMGVPLLSFMLLRLVVAGDFSMASYGAIQATRIYAMLVEPGDLAKTPIEFHPLMREIIVYRGITTETVLDRAGERDLYTRWMNGDFYAKYVVVHYLKSHFNNDAEANNFIRRLWDYELALHWRERALIYIRALRIAIGKVQQPILTIGLLGILWLLAATRVGLCQESVAPAALFFRWSGLWTILSLTTLLCVQFPDDRYLQVCYLWIPSTLGCAIALFM